MLKGPIHSVETLGTRDGPGLRCVFFLSGCNFRCKFCQNPDTWTKKWSGEVTLEEAKEHLLRLFPYLSKKGGGVTVSGGEPSLQADFVTRLFKLAHSLKLSTVLDTNGSCPPAKTAKLLSETDIVLLDIKASTDKLHRKITGKPLKPVLKFLLEAGKSGARLVLRRVLLPGINDSALELNLLASFAAMLPQKPEIELIPYHRLGEHKWKELGKVYPFRKLRTPSEKEWQRAAKLLRNNGLKVFKG